MEPLLICPRPRESIPALFTDLFGKFTVGQPSTAWLKLLQQARIYRHSARGSLWFSSPSSSASLESPRIRYLTPPNKDHSVNPLAKFPPHPHNHLNQYLP